MDDDQTVISDIEGPAPGTLLLDKYRVDWLLGIGGYGYVVKAHHLELGEAVAIKILRDDREIDHENVGRFLREAQAIVRLKSEHVARVHDVGKLPDTGVPYMIMELLDGEDLGKTLEREGAFEVSRAVDQVLQACEALAEAHALGIIHRDIKPTNLFLARLPGRSLVKVLDFGISKAARRENEVSMRLTQTQSVLGTPAYMSPEQMRSASTVDVRTDIWALGVVLYELVEGRLPFDASNFAELCVVVATESWQPMQRAKQLAPVIARCLAKQPEARFDDVADFALALAQFATPDIAREYVPRIFRLLDRELPAPPPLDGSTVKMMPLPYVLQPVGTTPTALPITRTRPRALWIAVTLLTLAVAALAALVVLRTRASTDDEPSPAVANPIVDTPAPAPPPDREPPRAAEPSKPAVAPVTQPPVATNHRPSKPGSVKKPAPPPRTGSGSARPKCAEGSFTGC